MDETWITTKGGDKGTTGLGNNERVPKDHPRVETYGTLDECQAHLRISLATCCDDLIRRELFEHLRSSGVGVQVHYIPVYLHNYYRISSEYAVISCQLAECVYEEEISIPIYPVLSVSAQEHVISEVFKAVRTRGLF